ncbi:MAG: hypothetical protein WB775_17590 [Burkholderiaceae bacterium]
MRLQLYIRHLMWTLLWPVPTWNLRHQSASRYERQVHRVERAAHRRLADCRDAIERATQAMGLAVVVDHPGTPVVTPQRLVSRRVGTG